MTVAEGAINLLNHYTKNCGRVAVLVSPSVFKVYGQRLQKMLDVNFFIYDGCTINFNSFNLVVAMGGERVISVVNNCGVDFAIVPTCPMPLGDYKNARFILIDTSVIYCCPKNILAAGIAKLMPYVAGFAKNIFKKQNILEICNTMLDVCNEKNIAFDMASLIKSNIPFGRKLLRCKEFLYGNDGLDDICNNIYFEPPMDDSQLTLCKYFALKRRLESSGVGADIMSV
ncbi:MAG: hypothetical protein FWD32_01655 [Firmicutes bacterium]|nr:hypothetical protein [Bacillota bacterium]